MKNEIVIILGKSQKAFYLEGSLILISNGALSDFTQLIMELGFSYTYLERYDIEIFPSKLSDLEK